jgi:hypothetical protein
MKRVLAWLLVIAMTLALCGCASETASAVRETDDAIKAQLLMDAMEYVGVCRPEQAVDVWVQGLMKRSAAMQYAVMDDELRKEYEKSLQKTAPNWVTGTSSPWVSGYTIGQVREVGPGRQLYTISVATETSTGPAGEYRTVLELKKDGDFWHISSIRADEGLSTFTGFKQLLPADAHHLPAFDIDVVLLDIRPALAF